MVRFQISDLLFENIFFLNSFNLYKIFNNILLKTIQNPKQKETTKTKKKKTETCKIYIFKVKGNKEAYAYKIRRKKIKA